MAWPNDYIEGSIRTQLLNYFYSGNIPMPSVLGTDYTGEKAIQNWRTDVGSSEGILLVPAGYTHTEIVGTEIFSGEIPKLDNNQMILSEDPANKGKIDFIFDADTTSGNIGLGTSINGAIMDIALSVDGSAFDSGTFGILSAGGYLIGNIITGIKGYSGTGKLTFGIQLQSNHTYLIDCAITDTDGWVGDNQLGLNCAGGDLQHVVKNITISAYIDYSLHVENNGLDLTNAIVQNGTTTLYPNGNDFNYIHCAIDQNISLDTDGYTLLETDGLGFPQSEPLVKLNVPSVEELTGFGVSEPYLFKMCFYDNSDDSLIGCEEDLEPEDTAMVLWEGDHNFPIYYYIKAWQWDGSEYSTLINDTSGTPEVINDQLFYTDDINGEEFKNGSWDRGADYYEEEPIFDPEPKGPYFICEVFRAIFKPILRDPLYIFCKKTGKK